eukprot:1076118-Alexandrium_andersonii.AAC.1
MSASLVGSEMCIRDSSKPVAGAAPGESTEATRRPLAAFGPDDCIVDSICLLYTSDAADDM